MGSFINQLMATSKTEPAPGMGVTFLQYSDRSPGTIVRVERFKSGAHKGEVSRFYVAPDKVDIVEITPAVTAETAESFTGRVIEVKRKSKGWRTKHDTAVSVGTRSYYYDPSF